jgi:predicted metal-binding protein
LLHVHRIKDAAILDHSVLVVAGREVHMPRAREVPGYRHVVATRGGRCRLIDRAAVHDLVLFGTSICHGGTHGVRAEEHAVKAYGVRVRARAAWRWHGCPGYGTPRCDLSRQGP